VNLVILLGAAAGSAAFCRLLQTDPIKAAHSLNITLTQAELKQLEDTFVPNSKDDLAEQTRKAGLCKNLGTVREMLCRKPPCPSYAVIIPKRPGEESQAA
jgi:hypothetical protein